MMPLKADMHVHSNHSIDSKTTINEMCRAAIEKGFAYICFAEHFDMNPHDDGYNLYNFEKYASDLDKARENFSTQLTILTGIEFSEPHRYPREFEKILKNGYDFVIGSIHWLGQNWVGEKNFQEKYSLERIYEMHYLETMAAVRFGGFDSLGHIDFPKRYLNYKHEPLAGIEAVLKELIKRGIALELNTSPIRKGRSEICPSDTILDLYMKNGGSKVTVGSDAHNTDQIGGDFDYIDRLLDNRKLLNVIFMNRKEKELSPV